MYAKKNMKPGFTLSGWLMAFAIGAVLMGSRSLSADPVITEFMADNDDNVALGEIEIGFGKPDPLGDGSTPDWIEIYNPGDEPLDLQGLHLTDDVDNLTRWTFPSVILEPDAYLLVFASGIEGTEFFDELGHLHTSFGLRNRGEYLALIGPDAKTVLSEFSSDGNDFPQQVSNVSYGRSPTTDVVGYLPTPTPGAANVFVDAFAGPLISEVTENPGALADDEDLLVTAMVQEQNASVGSVFLHYRIMFADEVSVTMVDNGANGDVEAGDGIYSATIPASASQPGQMVRWKVTAADVDGDVMRWPLFAYPDNSDEYFGTMVSESEVDSNLTVLDWFIDETNFRNAQTARGGRGSIFYLDQFYDNVNADDHGQSTRNFPKKSFDLDFNQGNRFEWQDGESRVRDINLITNWGDKAKFRHALAYEMYRDAGSPALFAFPVRVQKNGEFFSVADIIEDADSRTLARLGLNRRGALYKMYDRLDSDPNRWEKKTRRWEDKSDITALRDATRLRGEAWIDFAFDNLDIPEFVNFLPLFDLQNNKGCCHKNYYFYRDTGETNEWSIIIWDPDLAFGHDFQSGGAGYFNDVMDWNNPIRRASNNRVLGKLYSTSSTPGFDQMYLRRLRTLMDQLLQPTDTPYADRHLEGRIDEFVTLIDPNDDPFDPTPGPPDWPAARNGVVLGTDDADLDYNTWGSWDHGNGRRLHGARGETMRENAQRTKDEWLDQRRRFLYGQRDLPEAQVGNPILEFGVIEVEPASGDPAEEYIELANPQNTAVDISGWQLTEAVDFTFPAGTVIPSGWMLYVVADKNAFRARSNGPAGGQGLFLVGGWEGELSNGETLTLTGADGLPVRSHFIPPGEDEGIPFLRGDCNDDGSVDLSDAVCSLNWLFLGADEPNCVVATNANGDGSVNISDPTYLLNHLFLGGTAPVAPFLECGTSDLGADEALGCEQSSCP